VPKSPRGIILDTEVGLTRGFTHANYLLHALVMVNVVTITGWQLILTSKADAKLGTKVWD